MTAPAPDAMRLPRLTADCSRCAALCCLALAFDAGEDFAIDKPAGTPCPKLDGHRCGIHASLSDLGFSGCHRYDCQGAGQRVTQELFDTLDWRGSPALIGPAMDAFRGMRIIQNHVALISAAKRLPLSADDRAMTDGILGRLGVGAVDLAMAVDYPGSSLRQDIDDFIRGLRGYVTARTFQAD